MHRSQSANSASVLAPLRHKMGAYRATDWWCGNGAISPKRSHSSHTRYARRRRDSRDASSRRRPYGIRPTFDHPVGNGWRLLGRTALLGASERPVQESRADCNGVKDATPRMCSGVPACAAPRSQFQPEPCHAAGYLQHITFQADGCQFSGPKAVHRRLSRPMSPLRLP